MDRKSIAGSTASTIPPYRRHAAVNQLQPAVPAALLEPGAMEQIFKVSSGLAHGPCASVRDMHGQGRVLMTGHVVPGSF